MQQQDIGNQISKARKKLGYTQRELADKLGVSDKTISKWERGGGYPDISMLTPLCNVLGIELTQLLGEEGQTTQTEEKTLKTMADYAMLKIKENRERIQKIVWIVLSLCMVLGIGISVLCDYILTDSLSWSIIASAAIVYGWLLITALLWAKHWVIEKTLLVGAIVIFPFLYVLSQQLPQYDLLKLSWFIALMSDSLVLICYLILKKAKCSLWFKAAWIVIASGIFSIVIHLLSNNSYELLWIQCFGNSLIALILVILGIKQKRSIQHG